MPMSTRRWKRARQVKEVKKKIRLGFRQDRYDREQKAETEAASATGVRESSRRVQMELEKEGRERER